ncbi:MAG: TIR domain-containing protein [Hyalangium sp.]|uniref:TIR domain-containing protein n=1 Tax=Hyalangium sp. TaxID=2028555 RepID=UPI003899A2A8
MNPVLGAALLGGFLWWVFRDKHPKAFISFAVEDAVYRNYLVMQAKNERTPFKFEDYSLHEPFSNAWKTQTREIIRESDVVVVMIGSDTYRAEGALWEINAALEENVPVIGVHINRDPRGRVPSILRGCPVIPWTYKGLAREIRKALKTKK